VVIVDFWGTWCPPCRREVPHFIELYKKYKEAGFEMIGLNYQEESEQDVRDFVAANGVNYRCAIGDDATSGQIPDFNAFPTTIFVDRSGKVRAKVVGERDRAFFEAMLATLLAEPAPEAAATGG
jgi:thiol-disulfide isomerase/thioredoxin